MNQLCRVCGEDAAGFHFGAFTCEGCKSFFGRTYNSLEALAPCKTNNHCVISKANRTACKRCRLRKCLEVGMSKAGSRFGRRSNWFKVHCRLQDEKEHGSATTREIIHYVSAKDSSDCKLETKSTDSGIHSPEWDKHLDNRSPQHFYSGYRKDVSPQCSPGGYHTGRLTGLSAAMSPDTAKKTPLPQVSPPTAMSQLSIDERFTPPLNSFTTTSSQSALYMSPIFQVPGAPMLYKASPPQPSKARASAMTNVPYPLPKVMPAAMCYRYYGAYMQGETNRPFLPVMRQQGALSWKRDAAPCISGDTCRACVDRARREKLPYPPPSCIHKRDRFVDEHSAGDQQPLDLSTRPLQPDLSTRPSQPHLPSVDAAEGSMVTEQCEQPLDLSTRSTKSAKVSADEQTLRTVRSRGKVRWDTPKYRAMSEYYRSLSAEPEEQESEKYSKQEYSSGTKGVQYTPTVGDTVIGCRENIVPQAALPIRSSLV
ncbi:PREDICTED: uncharacterized protein LOC106809169 [Priapulus caudatus]|uniref:Uncharacterized protein LOC106809169 n=1 Tax=Priapulus caudatus TaxID=37621 RepID=A0ABM1E620_PRICU|nr:PREDICTED: uncharacterized protein LOC106809169 [Priapulus caudatus]